MTAKKAKLIPAVARINPPRKPSRAQKAQQRRQVDAWRTKTTANTGGKKGHTKNMTNTVPAVSVWHCDTGIVIALARPDSDTAVCAHLPADYVLSEFLPAVMAALDGYARHRDLADAVDAAITEGSLDDEDDH